MRRGLALAAALGAFAIAVALSVFVQARAAEATRRYGTRAIFLSARGAPADASRGGGLTEADGRAILRDAPSVAKVVPFLFGRADVVAGERDAPTTIFGTSPDYAEVRGYRVERGANLAEADERSKSRVCVLGAAVARSLFGALDPVGQSVRVGRSSYRVVGVLAAKGSGLEGGDPDDDRVLVPIGTFRNRLLPTAPGAVHGLILAASSERGLERAEAQATTILRDRHRIGEGEEPNFSVRSRAYAVRAVRFWLGAVADALWGGEIVLFVLGAASAIVFAFRLPRARRSATANGERARVLARA